MIRPTFPLNGRDIRRRVTKKRLFSPVTLGISVVALGGMLLAKAGVIGSLLFGGLAFAGIRRHLKKSTERFEAEARQELIAAINGEQDKALREAAKALREDGAEAYATVLERVVELKTRIETALHEDGALTQEREDIDSLVDLACAGITDELRVAADLESNLADAITSLDPSRITRLTARRDGAVRTVQKAFTTLRDTYENVVGMAGLHEPIPALRAMPGMSADSPVTLASTLSRLAEENQISRRARERVTDAWTMEAELGAGANAAAQMG